MVSEPDIGRCASEDGEPQRGWTPSGVQARTLGHEGGWTPGNVPSRMLGHEGGVDCEISHRLERGTSASEDVGP